MRKLLTLILLIATAVSNISIYAQVIDPKENKPERSVSYVEIDGNTLFPITNKGELTSKNRSESTINRIKEIAKDRSLNTKKIKINHSGNTSLIYIDKKLVAAITDEDAAIVGMHRKQYAQAAAGVIVNAIDNYRARRTPQKRILYIIYTILVTILFLIIIKKFNSFHKKNTKILLEKQKQIDEDKEVLYFGFISTIIEARKILRVLILIFLTYFYLSTIFKFFPGTAGYEKKISNSVLEVLLNIIKSTVEYLPNLIFITVTIVIAVYLNRLIKHIFNRIKNGKISISGFYREWASPTGKIIRFVIILFTLSFIFPYLPGADSEAFKGISIFVGAIVSLSSASAVANIIAGIVITYTRAFKVGDRVKIGETIGDIQDTTLLVTRVNTIKNVTISIPNAMVLSSHIENYTPTNKDKKLILHTAVTIGYDVPWKRVHELLIEAANLTNDILKTPEPFVLQTSLEDSYITYELNAYTNSPSTMAVIYSELHENIQDCFNKAGVEIMSTVNYGIRDCNKITIPDENLPKNYKPDGFRFKNNDN